MVIILGLGFTGSRLARRLRRGVLHKDVEVFAAVRDTQRFRELADSGVRLAELAETTPLPRNAILAHLIPPLPEPENAALREAILKLLPNRVVYVSSTGVYGGQTDVDWDTPAGPNDERGRLRLEEERWIASGPWSSLILRAAAIYGPGRGVHAALREGKMPRGAASGIVSRIHVEDLAALLEAGLFADLQGAWPVADEAPCSSAEIAAWCIKSGRAQYPPRECLSESGNAGKPIAGRKVNGGRIRQLLGVELKYPSWQLGIEASFAEEQKAEEEAVKWPYSP
jgi:nucleoside-diphosphate-sugar epimerase